MTSALFRLPSGFFGRLNNWHIYKYPVTLKISDWSYYNKFRWKCKGVKLRNLLNYKIYYIILIELKEFVPFLKGGEKMSSGGICRNT